MYHFCSETKHFPILVGGIWDLNKNQFINGNNKNGTVELNVLNFG